MTYSTEVLSDNPWGFWELTETSGALLNDSSAGSGKDMSVVGTSHTYAQSGPSSQASAIAWANAAGYAVTNPATSNTSTVTLESWVYLPANPSTSTVVIGMALNYRDVTEDKTLYVDTTGKVHWFTYDTGGNDLVSPSALSLNAWHHIVASVGPGGKKLRIDKSQVASNAATTSYTGAQQKVLLRAAGAAQQGTGAMRIAAPAMYTAQLSDARADAHYDAMYPAQQGSFRGWGIPL